MAGESVHPIRRVLDAGYCWQLGATLLLLIRLVAGAAEPEALPGDLKAGLLLHFSQFVEWPAEALGAPGRPFVIGVLGRDSLGKSLDTQVQNAWVAGHPVVVERYRNAAKVKTCHILFITPPLSARTSKLLARLARQPILTVGETPDFLSRQGMVRFYTNEQQKIRVQINLDAVKTAGLDVSSKLLRVADVEQKNSRP